MYKFDIVIIGAGVIGLALARTLSPYYKNMLLIEAQDYFGQGTSSRNSEVLHAGIYYQPQSLKAKLCAPGQRQIYHYLDSRNIAYKKTGKLIVATSPEQSLSLEKLYKRAEQNEAEDLSLISKKILTKLEPDIKGKRALFSKHTGIFDSHQFMHSLLMDFENNGGVFIKKSPLLSAHITDKGFDIFVGGNPPVKIFTKNLINAAGLQSSEILQNIENFPKDHIPKTKFFKGSYFQYQKKSPFTHLIYPVPEAYGLGIHATLDLQNNLRFGPDIEEVGKIDYSVNLDKKSLFYEAISTYWPYIDQTYLQPAYAGIRPKIVIDGQVLSDFFIHSQDYHHIPGLLSLMGIDSPGLTCCLSLSDYVKDNFFK